MLQGYSIKLVSEFSQTNKRPPKKRFGCTRCMFFPFFWTGRGNAHEAGLELGTRKANCAICRHTAHKAIGALLQQQMQVNSYPL